MCEPVIWPAYRMGLGHLPSSSERCGERFLRSGARLDKVQRQIQQSLQEPRAGRRARSDFSMAFDCFPERP